MNQNIGLKWLHCRYTSVMPDIRFFSVIIIIIIQFQIYLHIIFYIWFFIDLGQQWLLSSAWPVWHSPREGAGQCDSQRKWADQCDTVLDKELTTFLLLQKNE